MGKCLDILAEAGMIEDNRIPAIETWFDPQTHRLPEPMTSGLRRWFTTMLHGTRTPPGRRPRTQLTARFHLTWAMPALGTWKEADISSLRQVSAADIRAVLPLPVDPAVMHGALEYPDPARAAIIALVAFHGLRAGQIRALQLTGLRGGQAIREDRILREAHASGCDIRLSCDLFGLSVTAAERYTATVSHPGLTSKARADA